MTTKQGFHKRKRARVKLDVLNTDPERFQHRAVALDETQAEDLAGILKSGMALDPLDVWDAGDEGLIVVDGHHRLEAYHRAGWKQKVPVTIHACTEEEAQFLTVLENAKPRLQMTQDEKSGWSWSMVTNYPELSAKRIAEGPVSLRQVRYMRSTLKTLEVAGIEIPATWGAAQMLANGNGSELTDDMREERRIKLKAKLKESIRADLALAAQRDLNAAIEVVQEIMGKDGFRSAVDWMGFRPMTQAELNGEHLPF